MHEITWPLVQQYEAEAREGAETWGVVDRVTLLHTMLVMRPTAYHHLPDISQSATVHLMNRYAELFWAMGPVCLPEPTVEGLLDAYAHHRPYIRGKIGRCIKKSAGEPPDAVRAYRELLVEQWALVEARLLYLAEVHAHPVFEARKTWVV